MSRTWDSALVRGMLSRTGEGAAAYRPVGLDAGSTGCRRMAGTGCPRRRRSEILQMRLQRLTGLEQDKIVNEYSEVMERIADLLDILARPERITAIIRDELDDLAQGIRRAGTRTRAVRRSSATAERPRRPRT